MTLLYSLTRALPKKWSNLKSHGREGIMKRVFGLLSAFVFLFCVWGTSVLAADPSAEMDQLKQEVNKLLQRIEELEKKQTESDKKAVEVEKKTVEVEKKVADAEKKAEVGQKKALKDRVHLSGEARFRIMSAWYDTPDGFYGGNNPGDDIEERDETSFPTRIRLNMWAEVVPDIVDFYARLTMNKRWGSWESSVSSSSDPFDKPNSFEASIGHDITMRVEQAYATFKIPSVNSMWYVGRLPGLDGAPSRQDRSLFPRLFIDSEIDGTLIKWDAPHTSLDDSELPWTKTRLWGQAAEAGKTTPSLKAYEAKAKEKTGIILGYLKYDEKKEAAPDDSDVFLIQGLLKLGKGTSLFVDGLYMNDWHMPNSGDADVPDLVTQYYLTGVYADTQLGGCQVYGAYYYSHFEIPQHEWSAGTSGTFEGDDFPGHIWYVGFNTGDLLGAKHQFTAEYAKGSDAWINPFNYRGYRRKGTVLQAANNYFYDSGEVVGFYPFNAGVLDVYYDYYFRPNVRFRLGFMDFNYEKQDENQNSSGISILGSSKYEHSYWPYFEVNLSF
jgi:hypothetical protein